MRIPITIIIRQRDLLRLRLTVSGQINLIMLPTRVHITRPLGLKYGIKLKAQWMALSAPLGPVEPWREPPAIYGRKRPGRAEKSKHGWQILLEVSCTATSVAGGRLSSAAAVPLRKVSATTPLPGDR